MSCVQENSAKKEDADIERDANSTSLELCSAVKGKYCSRGRRNKWKDAQDAGQMGQARPGQGNPVDTRILKRVVGAERAVREGDRCHALLAEGGNRHSEGHMGEDVHISESHI